MKIEPFTVAVAEEVLTDLRERIERTRWPDHIPGSGWQYGADVEYLRSLLSSWTEFDWRPALRNNRPDRIALDSVLDPRRRATALLQPPAPPRQHAPLERPPPPPRWSAIASTATRAGARSGAIPHSGWTGNSVELERRVGGGACGAWVDRDDRRAIEPTGVAVDSPTTK